MSAQRTMSEKIRIYDEESERMSREAAAAGITIGIILFVLLSYTIIAGAGVRAYLVMLASVAIFYLLYKVIYLVLTIKQRRSTQ